MSDAGIHRQAAAVTALIPRVMRRLFALDADDAAMELPVAQLRVCGVLHDGLLTMSALSRELGISLSATTQLADRLEKAGLVERVAETDDRRVKCLCLTARGMEMMRVRRERRVKRAEDALAALAPEQRSMIVSALETLVSVSPTAAPDAPPGQAVEGLAE